MNALIWKECQENLKWTVLPVLLLGVPMVLFGPPAIMDDDYLIRLSFVAGVFGAALGFLQVFFESRGDRRALLLHRPISRSQVFLAKAVAGVGLYLLALGIPFAGVVAWTALPGSIPVPFRWQLVLPWLADILTGVVYYFAGMLLAQREARWYGSRGLGLAAAVLCSFLVWALPEFGHALVAIGTLGGLVAVAAWGSFLTGGAYAPLPRLAKAALAVTFLTGLLIAGVAVKAATGAWLDRGTSYRYELDRQGRLLLVHQEHALLHSVTDLEGRQLSELQGKWLDHSALKEITAPTRGLSGFKVDSYRNSGRLFVPYRNESGSDFEVWCYVPDEGRLLGYDAKSKRLIGRFGPDGFFPPDQQPGERFRGEPSYPSRFFAAGPADYLDFADGVYTVDFARRTLRTLFTPAAGETILRAVRWKDEKKKLSLAFVLTDQAVHVVDEAGLRLFTAPLAYDLDNYGSLVVGRLEDPQRYFCWYQPSWCLGPRANQTLPSYLVEYDPTGRETARRTVPPRPVAQPSYAQALYGLVTPPGEVALLAGPIEYLYAQARQSGGAEHNLLFYFLVAGTESFLPGVAWKTGVDGGVVVAFAALSLLSATGCALVCFLLARRHAFSSARCFGWSLCGLLFGPAGLLLLLALQEWPARIACPNCRQPRVVTRDACEHCGAPHASPAADGTEIFEPCAVTPLAAPAGR
jgi:hypothetical protein